MAYNLQHGLWPCSIVCGPVAWPMVCSMTCGTVAWHVALSMACGPWLAAVQQGVQAGLGYGRRGIGQGRIMYTRHCPHGHGGWLKGLLHLIVLQLLFGACRCICAHMRACVLAAGGPGGRKASVRAIWEVGERVQGGGGWLGTSP